jgi:heavy metal translocating P-type ATPase
VDWLRQAIVPIAALIFLAVGAGFYFTPPLRQAATLIWFIGLLVTGIPVVAGTIAGMFARQFAADIVASLSIVTAIALHDPLPGLVVVIMQTGGEMLERYAEGRASAAVRALEAEAPRIAHRVRDHTVEDLPVEQVAIGDRLLVRPGEMVPADGIVVEGNSRVDTSRLTGEPLPIAAEPGSSLMSGSLNGDAPLTIHATALSQESQYARIVELVRSAQASKSPLQRLADKYAVWFTPLTILVAAIAFLASHDPVRILAVFVVATPCPLILATPVAIIGGINSAARRQIVIRHGAALEQLGKVCVGVFDKTGTLTIGLPLVSRVVALPGFSEEEILRLTGAIEQGSSHLLARTLVVAALERKIQLPPASGVREVAGRGVVGEAEGRQIAIGTRPFIQEIVPGAAPRLEGIEHPAATLQAYVAIDGTVAGWVEYADRLRPNLADFFHQLGAMGIERTILLSGDHQANVHAVAEQVGIREAYGELLPEDKVRIINELVHQKNAVLMVGDGINDAPALSAATVGAALAGHGGGVTAEAADVVVLIDDLGRVADAIRISRRTLRIAHESIWVGLGLSGGAMIVAAFGLIPPTIGALIQEGIDVAVILNALRAAVGRRPRPAAPPR